MKREIQKTCAECQAPFTVKPYRELTARYCSFRCSGAVQARLHFNKTPTKPWSVGNKHRQGLKPAHAFPAGNVPWNRNLKGIHLSPGSEFKKGQEAANKVPVGTVSIRFIAREQSSRAFVKVAEPNRWRLRAIVTWEAANGPLPKGKVVHHKDRDKLNDELTNLAALTRREHLDEHRAEGAHRAVACRA